MRTIRIAAISIVGIFVGGFILVNILTTYVPIGYVGVRTQEYGIFGSQGVVQQDFGPGWHRDLGPIDSWVFFDSTIQTLEMTRDPARGTVKGRDDVQLQSADGYTVSADVTVKYRIRAAAAHKLYQDTGSREKYKVIVRNEAEKACLALFGQMKTEDFYNPAERRRRQDGVMKKLLSSLEDNYVEVVDVLLRDVTFDPAYEKKIQLKKLADQEVELNKSTARAEQMSGKTQVIEAETRKLIAVIKEEKEAALIAMRAETEREIAKITADAQKYAKQKMADADLVKAQNEAQGQLLVKKAEAEGEKLRNRAMMGVGGSTIVALEAARNLNLSEVMISTVDTDLLDIDKMATKLGVP
jgi:regulator of protease activity HflC (stomatin/prohibitin superfamily)